MVRYLSIDNKHPKIDFARKCSFTFDERKLVDPYFNKTAMVRGEKVMATHWGIMQAACNKWHGMQEEITDRPISGADFETKVLAFLRRHWIADL
jgi:hypothetical protein